MAPSYRIARKYLKELNIEFESQKKFENCKDKRCLLFDFYIPKLNVCLEYDGIQHFIPFVRANSEKEFEALKKRDVIKNEFCQSNEIRLIRISYYTKRTKIKDILNTLEQEFSEVNLGSQVLEMLSKDMSPEEICKLLNIDREKLSELETKSASLRV